MSNNIHKNGTEINCIELKFEYFINFLGHTNHNQKWNLGTY